MLKHAVSEEQLRQIRTLYEASFPQSGKKPCEMMLEIKEHFEVLSIEDEEGHFCGLAIMIISGDLVLLDYFAVEPACQGAGLGSIVLRELQERYGRERIVVEIERTAGAEAEAAENYRDRLRRKAFYLKNGMKETGLQVKLLGVEMEVLTFGRKLTFREYASIYEKVFSGGLKNKIELL